MQLLHFKTICRDIIQNNLAVLSNLLYSFLMSLTPCESKPIFQPNPQTCQNRYHPWPCLDDEFCCEQNSSSNWKSGTRATAVLQQRAARNAFAVVVDACAVCVSPVLLSLPGITGSIGGMRRETPAAPHPSLSFSLLSGALPHNTNTTRLNASSDVFTSS